MGAECDVWGLGHENFSKTPIFDSYDLIIDLENYSDGWCPSLANVKTIKCMWAIDEHVRGTAYYDSKAGKNKYDALFHSTKKFANDEREWLPNCTDNIVVRPLPVNKEWDIGFCGNTVNRGGYLDLLARNFNSFKKDIFVIGDDMIDAVNSYKIHFNCNICGDINYRSFETIACGTLLISNSDEQYNKLGFVDGENCLLYANEKELIDKIRETLADEAKLISISKNGLELSKNHTYDDRMRRVLSLFNLQ